MVPTFLYFPLAILLPLMSLADDNVNETSYANYSPTNYSNKLLIPANISDTFESFMIESSATDMITSSHYFTSLATIIKSPKSTTMLSNITDFITV